MSSFSRRHGYSGEVAPITVREDAPEALRHAVVQIAAEEGFESPSSQRAVICRVLRVMGGVLTTGLDPGSDGGERWRASMSARA